MINKLKKKILISLAVGGLIYLLFTVYADYKDVAQAFEEFNWLLLPLLLFLSLLNYFVRFLKWDYYLNILHVKVKKIDSFAVFMSGLIMSVTPGKMGEVLKSYLVKEISNTPISKTAPIIFVERITDSISLMFIALIGAYVFNYGRIIVVTVSIFFLFLVIVLSNKKIAMPVLKFFEKSKYLKKHLVSIHSAYESSYQMLRPLPLIYMILLSLVAWSFECWGYHIILVNFGVDVSFLWASFSYAFAIILGAISMLPGGLGATEGSLTFMLVQVGCSKNIAVASTFIVRAVTLWFAIFVGIISVTFYQNRFGKISVDPVTPE